MADNNVSDLFSSFIGTTQQAIAKLVEKQALAESMDLAVALFCDCRGKLITTGLGKAGHAAEKAASSFSSLGTPACFLHPAQASHGDVGIVQQDDVLLAFSNSGKTREVLETISLARSLGIKSVVSITAETESPVALASDLTIATGQVEEAGYLSIAPTSSVIVMLVVSDFMATLCARRKGLTMEQYGLRHHGGYIGRKCRGEVH